MDPSLILYSSAIKIDYNVHRLDHLTVEDNLADGVLVSAFFLSLYLLLLLICDWLFSFMSLAVCCRHNSLLCEAVLQYSIFTLLLFTLAYFFYTAPLLLVSRGAVFVVIVYAVAVVMFLPCYIGCANTKTTP